MASFEVIFILHIHITYEYARTPEPLAGLAAELEHFHEQRRPVIFERNALHLVEEHLCLCVCVCVCVCVVYTIERPPPPHTHLYDNTSLSHIYTHTHLHTHTHMYVYVTLLCVVVADDDL